MEIVMSLNANLFLRIDSRKTPEPNVHQKFIIKIRISARKSTYCLVKNG
jgi:hypothetical protein